MRPQTPRPPEPMQALGLGLLRICNAMPTPASRVMGVKRACRNGKKARVALNNANQSGSSRPQER